MNRIRYITAASLFAIFTHGPAQAQTTIELNQDGNPFLSIPLDDSQSVTIDPITGEIQASAASGFSCSTGGCEDVQVSFAGADGGFFNVNGGSNTSVPETGSVTFDWGARGAWECQGTGLPGTNWNNAGKLPFGPFSVSVSSLDPGNYDAGLICSNGAASAASASTVRVTVQESSIDIPAECDGRQPAQAIPTQLCESNGTAGPNTDVNCFFYASLFDAAFPGTQRGREFFLDRDRYAALEFDTTGMTETNGGWAFEAASIPPTNGGNRIMTISQCPGDFDRNAIESEMGPGCYVKTGGFTPSVTWKRAGTAGSQCELQLNTTYYLNIIFTKDPAGTPPSELDWSCENTEADACGVNIQPSFNQ